MTRGMFVYVIADRHRDSVAFDDRLAALVTWAFTFLQSWVDCRGPGGGLPARLFSLTGSIGTAAGSGKHEHNSESVKHGRAARHSAISFTD